MTRVLDGCLCVSVCLCSYITSLQILRLPLPGVLSLLPSPFFALNEFLFFFFLFIWLLPFPSVLFLFLSSLVFLCSPSLSLCVHQVSPFNSASHYHDCTGCPADCRIRRWRNDDQQQQQEQENQRALEHCRLNGLPVCCLLFLFLFLFLLLLRLQIDMQTAIGSDSAVSLEIVSDVPHLD